MGEAVRRAVARAGGVRQASGVSLAVVLCASALAPVVVAGLALGPVVLAGVGLAGSVGAGVLTEVVNGALDSLRDKGEADNEEAAERELTASLNAALSGGGEASVALWQVVAGLLRELGAVQAVVEEVAKGDERTREILTEGLAGLNEQFAEFAFTTRDIDRTVLKIHALQYEQLAESHASSERLREQSLVLSRFREDWRRWSGSVRKGADASAWSGCPYMGLVPFTQREAQVFYGRRDLTLRLRQALAERLTGGGVLLVTGPSGAGKSSLVRAGLVPALSQDVLAPGSGDWPCRVLTPKSGPLRELVVHLASLAGLSVEETRQAAASLALDPGRAVDLAAQALRAVCAPTGGAGGNGAGVVVGPRLVLIVDQFEEVFTLTGQDQAGRAERDAFIEALDALASVPTKPQGHPAALVAVLVRGDFLDQAFAYPALTRAQEAGAFMVGPMTEAELRQAITGPAAEARLQVEPDLVEEVVREVRDRPDTGAVGSGVLPLVSQVMAATWENLEDDRLTLRAYRRAGGLADAVNHSAQSVYERLDHVQQAIARAVFLRLTVVTADGRMARRPVGRAELHWVARRPTAEVNAVLEAFAARRLLVLERDNVEISHDVLLHSWGELHKWLGDDLVDRALYDQVLTDSGVWEGHGRDSSYLYRPGRLTEIEAAAARWIQDPERYPPLPPLASAFLDSGHKGARRGTVWRRAVIAGLTALTLIAGGATVVASIDAADADAQHTIALSRQLAAESQATDQTDPLLARQLAVAAWSENPTAQANAAMVSLLTEQQHSELIGHSGPVKSVAFSPNSAILASAGGDGTVRLWNPATGQEITSITAVTKGYGVAGVAFSPSGTVLASADGDGTAKLWNPATGQEIGAVTSVSPAQGVVFSPNGTMLASANNNGSLGLWDTGWLTDPYPVLRAEVGDPTAQEWAQYAPDEPPPPCCS